MRKIMSLILVALFLLSSLASANGAAEMTMLDKTTAIEKVLYGDAQTGSLVERVAKIEKDVYGLQDSKTSLVTKVDKLYTYTKETAAGSPSIIVKLNAVEWTLTHSVTTEAAKTRIEKLERILIGNSAAGSFDERLNKLLKLAVVNGQVDVSMTTLPKDTLIKIKLLTPLSTKQSRVGDLVTFQAVSDVIVGDSLVVGQGSTGTGKVTKVEPSRNFGRDAKLEISFDSVEAVDSTVIPTILGDKAKEETKSLAKAAGATVAGLVILGPIGVVGGAFVHGQDVVIPAGSEMYIQTSSDADVFSIKVK